MFRRLVLFGVLLLCAVGSATGPARAQGVTLIRDAEIEQTIRTYSTPILQAAGLNPNAIDIHIIHDSTLNAFVIPGNRMFLHTGLLSGSESPLELMGVIAHEAGHITGGHIAGRGAEMRNASVKAVLSMLVGLGAAAASGDGRAAGAVMGMGQDAALRSLLSYTRSQEQSADQAAVSFLRRSGLSPEGLRDFMGVLEGQEVLMTSSQDPYLRTHPLTRERLSFLEQAVQQSPHSGAEVPQHLQALHDRMKAKLVGFLESEAVVMRRYPEDDVSLPARYARAIAAHRSGNMSLALQRVDMLLEDWPQDPFFHELRGQVLLENGYLEDAVPSYRKAVSLQPDAPQIRLGMARAQVGLGDPAADQEARENLSVVLASEPANAGAWRLMSIVEGRSGDTGMAALALAEMNYAEDNWREARGQAERAVRLLQQGTAGWLRASDLVEVAKREEEREGLRKLAG